jgi:hypothetical protein
VQINNRQYKMRVRIYTYNRKKSACLYNPQITGISGGWSTRCCATELRHRLSISTVCSHSVTNDSSRVVASGASDGTDVHKLHDLARCLR